MRVVQLQNHFNIDMTVICVFDYSEQTPFCLREVDIVFSNIEIPYIAIMLLCYCHDIAMILTVFFN